MNRNVNEQVIQFTWDLSKKYIKNTKNDEIWL